MNPTADIESPSDKPLTIVVGLDFSDADGPAFDQAARIAKRGTAGDLHLVHVFDKEPSPERARNLAAHLRLYVDEKAATAEARGAEAVTVGIHLRSGEPSREIAQLAAEVGADLIVVGSHRGDQLKHWIVGSTAQKLMGAGSCPVLVASPWPKPKGEHKLVIEPPCPDCVRARAASGGSHWWCERHTRGGGLSGHDYSYQREVSFASLDSQVFPTGIDF